MPRAEKADQAENGPEPVWEKLGREVSQRVDCPYEKNQERHDKLGAAGVSTHSFRKTVATLIDGDGLSARIGADHLGHAKVSMTQNVYLTRGRVHAQVAELLDRAVAASDAVINDE